MSQVQDSPRRTPRCFFSYSWDSPEHRAWVQHLAARLRRDGVESILDEWHMPPGTDLPKAIETCIRESDFVVMVCTPKYTAKANAGKGGVGYEKYIVTGEMFKQKAAEKKFLPLVRVGDPDRDMPSFLDSKIYIDFRRDADFEKAYSALQEHLAGGKRPPPRARTYSRTSRCLLQLVHGFSATNPVLTALLMVSRFTIVAGNRSRLVACWRVATPTRACSTTSQSAHPSLNLTGP